MVVPRCRVTVTGKVGSVVSYRRPWVRTDIELADGTGVIVLRFIGRDEVPGFESGRVVVAEGTPIMVRGQLVMLNPRYTFAAHG
jgi:hypothetical protein